MGGQSHSGAPVLGALLALVACTSHDQAAPPAPEGSATAPGEPSPTSTGSGSGELTTELAPTDRPELAPTAPPPVVRGMGTLVVEVRDERGRPLPARLTFVGLPGTRTPAFTRADIGIERPGGIVAFDRAFVTGDATLLVPKGSYAVWFSHGPEWEAVSRTVHVGASTMTSLTVMLRHVVDTPGWTSGDFHVHAERSFDSKVPMRHRVYQFVADAVDLIVATDHDVIADYAPVIAQLGQRERLASLQGDEVTTRDWGHFGAFPLSLDPILPRGGALTVKGRTPASLFAELRARWPVGVIDVHHPRLEKGKMGYFHLGELDTRTLRSKRPGFSFDFDAIEVLNGYQDPDRKSVDAVLADWFAFLLRGHRITATGNSDTHHLTFNLGGYPRNYVQLPEGPLDQLDGVALARAVKAGHSYFTTGPIVDVSAGSAGLGDTVATHGKPLALHVRVRAPSWVSVDRVSVIVDGIVVVRRTVTGTNPVRFDDTLSIPVTRDGFVIVRVDGDRPMAPVIGDGNKFKVYPLAVTNPIWVDADGDGKVAPTIVD